MKTPQQKLHTSINTLRIILQLATRSDLAPDEEKFLKNLVRSQELAVAMHERRLVAALHKTQSAHSAIA